jgi:hypothetical protein
MDAPKDRQAPCTDDYLSCREFYKLAYHRWNNQASALMEAFGCTFGDLEEHILEQRGTGKEEIGIARYAALSHDFDEAATLLDQARDLQQQKFILERDLRLLEC